MAILYQKHRKALVQRMSKYLRPTSPYASPTLPPEIVHLIVQDERLTKPDFLNLSLVSYVWKEASQRRLFSSISLDPGEEHPLFRILPNSDSTRLIRYIKHLTLVSTPTNPWTPFPCDSVEDAQIQLEDDPELEITSDDYFHNSEFVGTKLGATHIHMVPDPEASGPPHPKFPSFLHQLSKLETLIVRDRLNWYLLPRDTVEAFCHIFALDSFRSLEIWRDSATRLPFIFLHFCFNLKRLSLDVWPTTLLEPIGIHESDLLALREKPIIRPTALKLTGANVADAVNYYVDRAQSGLGNFISLDRLRALYIAYDEDPACATMGTMWPSKRVGTFLSSFGRPLEELVLEIDHRCTCHPQTVQPPHTHTAHAHASHTAFSSRAASPIPAPDLSNLTNLLHLRLILYNGPLTELDFNEAFTWLLPFLTNLPNPSNLETLQLIYSSSFRWTEEFGVRVRRCKDFLEELFDVLASSFTGLKAVTIQMMLISINGLSDIPPVCDIVNRRDFTGLVKLQEMRTHTVCRVCIKARQ